MATNRRNHYRLLHVQSDAPPEVIKASYRALMALHHPDIGGDHATAVLLNEAHAVLSDSARRRSYDAQRVVRSSGRTPRDQRAGSSTSEPSSRRAASPGMCPLCQLGAPAHIRADSRCTRCRAPLAPVPRPSTQDGVAERRRMPRVTKSDWALLYMDWPSEVSDVRMRDLSLDGISVYSGIALPLHRTIRVVGAAFDVVADIVSCRRVGKVFTLHAQLTTALFTNATGGFVSTSA